MSRHGYTDDCDDDPLQFGRWRGRVASAIRGKRGQAFLRDLIAALDAMPVKELIANELVTEDGACCAIGAVCLARGIDTSKIDYECPEEVGAAVGIASSMAAEIEYENDEWRGETDERRWQRMRRWAERHLKTEGTAP